MINKYFFAYYAVFCTMAMLNYDPQKSLMSIQCSWAVCFFMAVLLGYVEGQADRKNSNDN